MLPEEHNIDAMQKALELKKQKELLKVTADDYTKKLDDIKGGKRHPNSLRGANLVK